jgi:hypothetical protein
MIHYTTIAVPNLSSRNITYFFQLEIGSFVIMRSTKRFYVGEVLDIYQKGSNNRYGSVAKAINVTELSFLSLRVFLPLTVVSVVSVLKTTVFHALDLQGLFNDNDIDVDEPDSNTLVPQPIFAEHFRQAHLHTHAPVSHIVYHLGQNAMMPLTIGNLTLTETATKMWHIFTCPGLVRQEVEK